MDVNKLDILRMSSKFRPRGQHRLLIKLQLKTINSNCESFPWIADHIKILIVIFFIFYIEFRPPSFWPTRGKVSCIFHKCLQWGGSASYFSRSFGLTRYIPLIQCFAPSYKTVWMSWFHLFHISKSLLNMLPYTKSKLVNNIVSKMWIAPFLTSRKVYLTLTINYYHPHYNRKLAKKGL